MSNISNQISNAASHFSNQISANLGSVSKYMPDLSLISARQWHGREVKLIVSCTALTITCLFLLTKYLAFRKIYNALDTKHQEVLSQRDILIRDSTNLKNRQAKFEEKNKQIESLEKSVATSKSEKEEAQSRLNALNTEFNNLKNKLAEIQRQLKAQAQSFDRESSTLRKRLEENGIEFDKLSAKALQEKQNLEKQISDLKKAQKQQPTLHSEELTRQIAELQAEIKRYQQELETTNKHQEEQLLSAQTSFNKQIQDANTQKDALQTRLTGLEERRNVEQKQQASSSEEFTRQITELQAENKKQEEQFHSLQQSLNKQLQFVQQEKDRLQSELTKSKQAATQIEELKASLDSTKNDLQIAKNFGEGKEQEAINYYSRLEAARQEKKDALDLAYKQRDADIRRITEACEAEKKELQKQLKETANRIAEAYSQLETSKAELITAKKERDAAIQAREEAKKQLGELEQAETNIRALAPIDKTLQLENAALNQKIISLRDENSALSYELQELRKKIAGLEPKAKPESSLNETREKTERFKTQINDLEEELTKKEEQINELRSELDKNQELTLNTSNRAQEQSEELAKAEKELEEAKNQVELLSTIKSELNRTLLDLLETTKEEEMKKFIEQRLLHVSKLINTAKDMPSSPNRRKEVRNPNTPPRGGNQEGRSGDTNGSSTLTRTTSSISVNSTSGGSREADV